MRDDQRYVSIPGTRTHELPPLMVQSVARTPLGDVLDQAAELVEAEDILPDIDADERILEQRKFDLAVTLAEEYKGLIAHWLWGNSILEWIRQCEITFGAEATLRHLLHPDVWPHASRSSFVTLLLDKAVPTRGVRLERAVGMRLTFRQPPPIDCFSNQFLFFLNSTMTDTAYRTWALLNRDPAGLLPPERFSFQVLDVGEAE
jgi:hypothetical protein